MGGRPGQHESPFASCMKISRTRYRARKTGRGASAPAALAFRYTRFSQRRVHAGTAAAGLAAALVLLAAGYPIAVLATAVPCGVLGYVVCRKLVSLQLGAGLALLLELALFGGVWPAIHTLAAELELPALGFTVR